MKRFIEYLVFLYEATAAYKRATANDASGASVLRHGHCLCVLQVYRGRAAWIEHQRYADFVRAQPEYRDNK